MFKLIIFLFALQILETYSQAAEARVEPIARTELKQNIIAASRNFNTEYSKVSAGLPGDDIYAQTNSTVSELSFRMKDIFKRENDSVAEYYKEKVAKDCVFFLDVVYNLINIYDQIARDPIVVDEMNATYSRNKGIAIYQDTNKELDRLISSASTCENNECIEIQKRLNDLNVERKMTDIVPMFEIYYFRINEAMEKIRHDLNPYRIRYEQEAIKSFRNFKNCIELKKQQEEFYVSRSTT